MVATVVVGTGEEDCHRTKSGSPSSSSFLFPFPFSSSVPQSETTTTRQQPMVAGEKEGGVATAGPLARARAHPRLSASPSSGLVAAPLTPKPEA